MAKSLKQKNQPQLVTFVLVNVVVFGMIAFGLPNLLALAEEFTKGNWGILGKVIAIPAVITLVIGILGWAMPSRWQEALVFWRTGRDCLPSSRAFTVLGPSDPRVDMRRLALKHGPLPTLAAEQTSLWYRIYRSHIDEISVEDAHGAYLRFREMTTLALAVLFACVATSIWVHTPTKRLILECLLVVVEYLFLMIAARNAATHFVKNVLAIESSAPMEAAMLQ